MDKNLKVDLLDQIKIIPKPDSISWEEITELLHDAFSERAEQGLNYKAVDQDVETTIKRVGNGICLVALHEGTLIGTATLRFRKGKRWFEGKTYGYLTQLAVRSEFKNKGVGGRLHQQRLKIGKEKNLDSIVGHTSINATSLINWHLKQGAQKVAIRSGTRSNYYSVYLRYPIKENDYSQAYIKLRYYLSYIICVLMKKKKGGDRLWVRALNKLKRG